MTDCNAAMVLQTLNPLRLSKTIRIVFVSAVVSFAPLTAPAAQSQSASTTRPSTHREFVDSCLGDLARTLLSRFTPNRTEPIVIVADTIGDLSGNIVRHVTGILSDRGLLIRNPTPEKPDSGSWSLSYALDSVELSLSEPERREYLGRIWVKRTLHAGLTMTVHDVMAGEDIWNDSLTSNCFDWVAKRDLEELEDSVYAPMAPSTGWEKAKAPLIIGGIGLVTGVVLLTAF